MRDSLAKQIDRYVKSRHQKKHRTYALRCLALLVVFATVYALILPAVTMSSETVCGKEEHTHSEECWTTQMVDPQPQIVCEAGKSGEVLIHRHDSYCYDNAGNLICDLPEREFHAHTDACYRELKEYTCEEVQDLGHTHTGACYAYSKGELICGLEEEPGHVHTDECYPTERVDEPTCGKEEAEEGNPEGKPAHTHDEACFTVVVRERFKCGLEETDPVTDEEGNVIVEGHHHDSSCKMSDEELRICGQTEDKGHTHDKSCWEWTERLVCSEDEREPGHIHTEECYHVERVLACQTPELTVHTHSETCRDEFGSLSCGKAEVAMHQHTEECRFTPEGEAEETRVLTCGMEEHAHGDICYVEILPDPVKYYCGFDAGEHIHNSDCYFESGALWCTLQEHMHTAECLEEPLPADTDEPADGEDPAESQPPEEGVLLEDYVCVYTENEAFTVTYTINGFATLDNGEGQPDDVASGEPEPGAEPDQGGDAPAEPEPGTAEPTQAPQDDPTPAVGDEVEVNEGEDGQIELPLSSGPQKLHKIGNRSDDEIIIDPNFSHAPDADADASPAPADTQTPEDGDQTNENIVQLDPALVKINVTELEEGTPEYEAILAGSEKDTESEETMFLFAPLLLNASYMGRELDLSRCTMTVKVEPTTQFIEQLESMGANVMAIDELDEDGLIDSDGTAGEMDGDESIPVLSLFNSTGEVLDAIELTEGENVLTVSMLSADQSVAVSASDTTNPKFTVQYYANLNVIATTGTNALTLIDTSGGKLPQNKKETDMSPNDNALKHMYVDSNGNVEKKQKLVEVFASQKAEYVKKPNVNYFNVAVENTNYELKEVWILKAGGNLTSVDTADWDVFTYDNTLHFTNRELVSSNDGTKGKTYTKDDNYTYVWVDQNKGKYIRIKDGDVIRLVYNTTAEDKDFAANFYDYDITTGCVYTEPNPMNRDVKKATSAQTNNEIWYAWTYERGINDKSNYSGSGTKLAFGNKNANTGLGELDWHGNKPNMTNSDTFKGCTFGIASGLDGEGNIVYSSGLNVPKLFNETGDVMGKTPYWKGEYSLKFARAGDTYTLSAVNGTGATGLENFGHPSDGLTNIWTNHFWPMDSATSWGADGHDLKFGSTAYKTYRRYFGDATATDETYGTGIWTTMPTSDDGKDHNSYFGMNYQVKFDLVPEYIGPLEYYFFGDDDMWVFLDGRLVCDIGGVHSSVGEYVNLWDYLHKHETECWDDNGKLVCTAAGKTEHTLSFFYTERGASGSTCWMQFTLPSVVSDTPVQKTSGLTVSKTVQGLSSIDPNKEFTFKIYLRDAKGEELLDDYKYTRYGEDGGQVGENIVEHENVYNGATFTLKANERIYIEHLPAGTKYKIEELKEDDCSVSYIVDSGTVQTGKMEFTALNSSGGGDLQIINTYYKLPETGGAGLWYTMAALPFSTAMLCVWYKKKTHGKGTLR